MLKFTNISKRFGGVQALQDVSFEIAHGTIHAIVGENGAGKSTLMKALSGALVPDGGEMYLDGEKFEPRNPHHSRDAGVAMIYQGKIVWTGPISQIDRSGNPYVEQFIHGRAEGPIKMPVKVA